MEVKTHYRPLMNDSFQCEGSGEKILRKYSEKLHKISGIAEGIVSLECYSHGWYPARRADSAHPEIRILLRDEEEYKLGFYGEITWEELIFEFESVQRRIVELGLTLSQRPTSIAIDVTNSNIN